MLTRRRTLIGSVVVIALVVGLTFLALTAWGGPRDKPSPVRPTGPAADAAERARAALATRLGTTADRITVESAEEHTWNDASLGLPEPGMMYAQVITSGHIVTLTCEGQRYVYHVAGQAAVLEPASK